MLKTSIYVKHIGKSYDINVSRLSYDNMICEFLSTSEYEEFFNSFHRLGDVNYVDGEYVFRHDVKSYQYEIFMETTYFGLSDKVYHILEVMGVDYVCDDTDEENNSANISFLNGDIRSEEVFNSRFREIKIIKLLSER